MSGETQPRRRKDKRKKKDSVSDDGTGDEEMKGHSAESGGSSCVTVLVFMVLLAAVGVLLGLIYVQSQGIAHVETPAQPVAQPRVETIVETITEGGEASPPADDQGEGAPADQQEQGGQQAEVVEQVIEEHIVYVDAPPDQQQGEQVVYVESPPVADGIQLEGSEPQLEEQYGAQPAAPPPVPRQMAGGQEVVQEERLVRMRQVVRQVTDADGNVQEEVISEEEVPEDYVEPGESATVEESASDQAAETTPQPEQQQQQEEEAPATDEGVDVTEPAEDSPAPPAVEGEAAVEVEVEKAAETEEAAPAQEKQEEQVETASEAPAEAEDAPPQEEVSEAAVEEEVEDATPQVEEVEEMLTEAEVEDEPQPKEHPQEEVASPAEPPAPASVPSSHSVPVDTNKQERPAAQQKPSQAEKVEESKQPVKEDKPKEPVKEEKVKEPVKEEKVKEPVKKEKVKEPVKEEKAKEPVKEEKAKEPVKEEKAKEPVKEEKAKEPVKEEKAKEPLKEEKAKEPIKEEKPNEPVNEEKAKEPVKDEKAKASAKEEKVKEPVKEEKAKEPVKEEKAKETVEAKKTKEPLKEEKPTQKPTQSEAKPTETPVKKETPTEKPKVVAPTEKPAVKEAPTEKPAPKVPLKEAEEIERVRSGSRGQQQRPGPASKPADKPQEEPARARSQPPVESATDKHAKQTGKQAVTEEDEGIVADVEEQRDEPSDAGAEYGKADVTGPEDWDIREELDAADGVVDTDPLAALNAFGAILSRRPRSPRALWGRARALNAQATQERSNNALDKAIKAFRVVLDLEPETPVPLELYRQAAETCVQQMRFRGQLDQAARIQQRLIQKFPDNHQLRNHLATVFMTYGQNSAAEEVLQEVLRLWPDNGYAKVHLGFIRRQEGKHQVATELMKAGLASDEPGVHDERFYYALGDSYDRIGRRDRALEIYQEAVSRGLMLSVLQRSLINVDRLTARPYWTAEQSGSGSLVRELEANFQTIRDEMLTLLDSERPEDGFQPEQEDLSKSGDWRQYTMYRRGRKNQYACVKTPRTCDLIAKFPEAAGCRRGQIKFSMLGPGTTVWPHTGPTNCRLRLHLGLKVPNGTGIRVAGEKRTWEEGKVLIIDDSFEHDVWNESDATRYVLIVDIWHPELTEEERRTLPSI